MIPENVVRERGDHEFEEFGRDYLENVDAGTSKRGAGEDKDDDDGEDDQGSRLKEISQADRSEAQRQAERVIDQGVAEEISTILGHDQDLAEIAAAEKQRHLQNQNEARHQHAHWTEGLDEEELDMYLLDEDEFEVKKHLWWAENYEFMVKKYGMCCENGSEGVGHRVAGSMY